MKYPMGPRKLLTIRNDMLKSGTPGRVAVGQHA